MGLFVGVLRGDENDGRVAVLLTNPCRGLEAVEPRHPDVEKDDRELAIGHDLQRSVSRARLHEMLVEWSEQGLEHDQVRRIIVDEQNARATRGRRTRSRRSWSRHV